MIHVGKCVLILHRYTMKLVNAEYTVMYMYVCVSVPRMLQAFDGRLLDEILEANYKNRVPGVEVSICFYGLHTCSLASASET